MFSQSKRIPLLIAALISILAALVWHYAISDQLLKIPKDFFFTADVVSVDNFYNEESGEYSGQQFSKTEYEYRTVNSTSSTLTLTNRFSVNTPDDDPIFSVTREYGINRISTEHISNLGDTPRTGYLFAPKGINKDQTFDYWHVNYDGPATMEFVEEETLYGLNTYHFISRYKGVTIDQTENLDHLPLVGSERGIVLEPVLDIWIEPVTGKLIKYTDDTIAYYYDLETGETIAPWNHFSNTFSEESVEITARNAQNLKSIHLFVKQGIPGLLILIGLALIILTSGLHNYVRKHISWNTFALVFGTLFSLLSLFALVLWSINANSSLLSKASYSYTISPLTCICLLLLGISAFTYFRGAKIVSAVVSGGVTIIALIRILDLYTITNIGINEILFTEQVIRLGSQMSLLTAISCVLLASNSLFLSSKTLRELKLTEITSNTVSLFMIITLIAHAFNLYEILSLPVFSGTSVYTAILLLSLSLFAFIYSKVTQKKQVFVKTNLTVFGILSLCVIGTISVTTFVDRSLNIEAETRFKDQTTTATTAIQDRIEVYINALEGAKGLLAASDVVERKEWKAYVDSLNIQENYPGIQGIGYSIFVDPQDLTSHINTIRAEGFPEYTVRPEGPREQYTAIVYLEPFDVRNQQAFGYDMFSESNRRRAMELARDTGEPRSSAGITLVQEIDDDVQSGFLIYVPFFDSEMSIDTIEQRRESIIGYSYSPFRARDFVEGVLGDNGIQNIGLSINDSTIISPETEIYNDNKRKFESVSNQSKFTDSKTIFVAGRPWVLNYSSSTNYGQTIYSLIAPMLVFVTGLAMSILITLILYTVISSRENAVQYANKVTEDLKQSKAKDEAILNSIGNGLIATDVEGNIILTNPAFTRILGWTAQEVLGKKLSSIVVMLDENKEPIPDNDRLITKALKEKQVTKTKSNEIIYYKRNNGTILPVSITVSPVLRSNKIIGAVEVFKDITNEKAIDKAKTEFVSLASHQLRTPLTAINWYVEILLGGDAGSLTKDQTKYLNEIYKGNQRMVSLVNSLLNVSRLELGTFMVDPEKINVIELTQTVVNELSPRLKKKQLELTETYSKDSIIMEVDPELMQIVIDNLLTNAVKYTPEGGKIDVRISQTTKDLHIEVEDTGLGIPKDQADKIFTKLFRADNVKESDTQGTGLGLYLAKSIIDYSGGKIWFESVEEKGTTFHVVLPNSGMKKRKGSRKVER